MLAKRAAIPVRVGDNACHGLDGWCPAALGLDCPDASSVRVEDFVLVVHLHQVAGIVAPVGVARRVKANHRPHRIVFVRGSDEQCQTVAFAKDIDGLVLLVVLVGPVLALVDGFDEQVARGTVVKVRAYPRAVVGVILGVGLR